MRIRLLTDRATAGGVEEAGRVIDLPDVEARRLIASGQAELCRKRRAERAVKPDTAERTDG